MVAKVERAVRVWLEFESASAQPHHSLGSAIPSLMIQPVTHHEAATVDKIRPPPNCVTV